MWIAVECHIPRVFIAVMFYTEGRARDLEIWYLQNADLHESLLAGLDNIVIKPYRSAFHL